MAYNTCVGYAVQLRFCNNLEWDDCISGAETRRLGFGEGGEGRTEGTEFLPYF